jgi:hypothetical protein
MMRTVVAVHQPNYLPWLGFFHKLLQCDVFVILDDAQIQKTGSSWVNRTQILRSGERQWLTIPITRPSGVQEIRTTLIAADGKWQKSHRGILHEAYRDAPFYRELSDLLDQIFACQHESLLEFNLRAVRLIVELLELSDAQKFVMASSLGVKSQGTARLIDLVKRAGGESYLCGSGSSGYLEPDSFKEASVRLVWQDFVEEKRSQLDALAFVPGLSVLDSLLLLGPSQTREYLCGVKS